MRFRLSLLGLMLMVSLLVHSSALAQSWLADGRRIEGQGVEMGALRLHGGVASEMGWVNNVFLADEASSSASLRVTPHLYLTSRPRRHSDAAPDAVRFETHLNGSFKHYFATDARSEAAVGQGLSLSLRPSSLIGLDVFEQFNRSIDPFTDPAPPPPSDEITSFARDRFAAGARLQLSTPGEVLKTGLGYRFEWDHFEDEAFRDNRNRTHTASLDVSWEFYPKTALFWISNIRLFQYVPPGSLARVSRRDSTNVDSRIGLNGAITASLSLTAAIGYGAGFFTNDNDYEALIAQLEARLRVSESVLWSIGAERGINPAFQGDYARVNRVKSRVSVHTDERFLLALGGEVNFVQFGRDATLASLGAEADRDDIVVIADVSGEYRVLNWFAVTGDVSYGRNFTDFVFPPLPRTMLDAGDEAAYEQFQVWLGLRAFW
jgi:hypothetical protein